MDNGFAVVGKGRVALEPIQVPEKGFKMVAGIAMAQDKGTLIPSKVVYLSRLSTGSLLMEGDTVWVTADTAETPFAKQVLTLDDKKFVLIPEERCVICSYNNEL